MKKYTILLLCFLVLITLLGCDYGSGDSVVSFGDTGISVDAGYKWGRTGHDLDYVYVKGDILNTGNKKYYYLELWGEIYNAQGQIIAKEYTNFVDLFPGEKRSFEMYTKLPNESIRNVEFYIKH